ncbi:MAG: hypothetical protein DYG96_05620 [Chlorobi bacterium CHB2]|nr:hypothetical protein [Chlorobi bacterium CHB2]
MRLQSTFLKHVLALATGTAMGQLVTLLFTPITTRLFAPSDFAGLAIYSSLSALFGVLATLTYEQAIVVVEDEGEAWACTLFCILVSFFCASLLALIVWIGVGGQGWVRLPGGFRITRLMGCLVAVSLLANGSYQSLYAWLNRKAQYHLLATGRLVGALVTGGVTVLLGVLQPRGEGLAAGILSGIVANVGVLLFGMGERPRLVPLSVLLAAARRHARFPRALLPSWLIDRCTTQAYLTVFSSAYGEGVMGALALYMRLIGVPLNTVGNAVGDVVRQRAAVDLRTNGTCRPLFLRAAAILAAVGVPGTVLLLLLAPSALPFLLGSKWTEAGFIARIMAPQFAFALVAAPLSAILTNRPALDLVTKTTLLALLIPVLLLADRVPHRVGIALFCAALCLKYCVELYLAWRTSLARPKPYRTGTAG